MGVPFRCGLSRLGGPFARVVVTMALAASTSGDAGAANRGAPTRIPLSSAAAPVLQARCVRCHGPAEASGGLRLDSYDAIMRGGERGPVVVPGNPKASLLVLKVLRRDKPAMPPRKPLTAAEVRKLSDWIESGAGP